ncbi:heparan-alpha-glucosaminide N-acetyltransferase domain-containing protein [Microbulbifer sp. OS29]|uniref:Heparan-alpha-glucosaminide N-acetyltransferase domain-containing protein n=1 Tax=Microbulbifer okhotskensis TaxID=2926617 RepID=A0A9X2EQT2_9GAMM|nr:heparan-alpha-glucosaminide N-acetyltransferase domain-containing protein [Microbulbifer okhotskensis]MCO1336677.1 heparan-alpha-glucosaminide N-acetyltransferase domain-containing protein [Microbulbifer okhotskensis]
MRYPAIDITRGILVVIMALDHTRDYWTAIQFDPLDLSQSSAALFLTRWITHICAPGFIFLTGLSTYFHGERLNYKQELAKFLLVRGIVLVIFELTLVNLSWQFAYNFAFVQVIWALGVSMIILAGLIYLPKMWTTAACLAVVILHGYFNDDYIRQLLGGYEWLWILAHVRTSFQLFEFNTGIFAAYNIIPLFALMYLGYASGALYQVAAKERVRLLITAAAILSLIFIISRIIGFGDPNAWNPEEGILDLINASKYPMSFSYIMMTMSIIFLIMALAERRQNSVLNVLLVFGQASLFFYLLHVPIINLSAHLWTQGCPI